MRVSMERIPVISALSRRASAQRTFSRLTRTIRKITIPFELRAYRLFAPHEISIASFYTPAPVSARRIPNTVYQTWRTPTLPFLHAKEVEKFRRRNPDFSFRFFSDNEMDDYMRTSFGGHPILEVFRKTNIPAAKADIWRYCILFCEGGVYCDIDSGLSIPIRELLTDDPSEVISFEENAWRGVLDVGVYADPTLYMKAPPDEVAQRLDFPGRVVLNWFLCFEKASPILEEVINLIVSHFDFYKGKKFESMWKAVIHCTGQLALTQALWMWMQRTGKRPTQCGIDFAGAGEFKLPGSGIVNDTFTHYSRITNSTLFSE